MNAIKITEASADELSALESRFYKHQQDRRNAYHFDRENEQCIAIVRHRSSSASTISETESNT